MSGVTYKWWVQPGDGIADAPAWLYEAATPPRTAPTATGEPIPEGGRNAALASLAGAMRSKAMSEQAILAALLAENTARCTPPLPEDEVRSIARSVARYEPDPNVVIGEPVARVQPRAGYRLPYRTAREIADTSSSEPDWVIYGYIARQAITELDGKVKAAGKTTPIAHAVAAILDGPPGSMTETPPARHGTSMGGLGRRWSGAMAGGTNATRMRHSRDRRARIVASGTGRRLDLSSGSSQGGTSCAVCRSRVRSWSAVS